MTTQNVAWPMMIVQSANGMWNELKVALRAMPVTMPVLRTALVAGGMLAFALSFDEVIVTTFTAGTQETIPLWIYNNIKLPNQRAIVNVVAVFLILLSLIPVFLAQRLASDRSASGGRT